MSYYDDVIQANILPNHKVRDAWRRLEASVKLTSFHTQECARATWECAYWTQVVADKQKHELLNKILEGS